MPSGGGDWSGPGPESGAMPPSQPGGPLSGSKRSSTSRASSADSRLYAHRLPPHDLEAERSVIGTILVQNEAIDQVREVGLTAEHFYRESNRRIFEVCSALADRREPIDLVLVSSALKNRGWFEGVGGSVYLTQLFEDAFAIGNVTSYARVVRDKAIQRKLIEACNRITHQAFQGVENTEEFLDQAETEIFAVSDIRPGSSMIELRKILLDNMKSIEDLALRKEEITGLGTGFRDFDLLTTGLHPGQVLIIAARPGMGKTSWVLSALQNAAIHKKSVCAVFSLEMSKEEIGFKLLSGLSRIENRKLKVGKLADRDWQRLAEAADQLAKSKIFIDDSGALGVMDIRARCRRLASIEKRIDLIVIDYLQLMRGSKMLGRMESSREREIAEISRGLKELAKELKVPVVALSQLNRGVESRQDKRPGLADLRESGAIEQDADIVAFIHREDYYDKETENRGVAELIVAKNRSGEQATLRLAWLGQYTLFSNLSEDEPGTPVDRARPERGDITL